MKVGDLVRRRLYGGAGIIVGCREQPVGNIGPRGFYIVHFGSELDYLRKEDLEVLNESR